MISSRFATINALSITGILRHPAEAFPEKEGTVKHAQFVLEHQTFMAMESALVELVCTEAYQEGRLTWHGLPDLGLPVVDAIKDRLRK